MEKLKKDAKKKKDDEEEPNEEEPNEETTSAKPAPVKSAPTKKGETEAAAEATQRAHSLSRSDRGGECLVVQLTRCLMLSVCACIRRSGCNRSCFNPQSQATHHSWRRSVHKATRGEWLRRSTLLLTFLFLILRVQAVPLRARQSSARRVRPRTQHQWPHGPAAHALSSLDSILSCVCFQSFHCR